MFGAGCFAADALGLALDFVVVDFFSNVSVLDRADVDREDLVALGAGWEDVDLSIVRARSTGGVAG